MANKYCIVLRKSCTMPPLLNIPFEFVVVDTLHLFLRIMGLLFHQVSLQASYRKKPFLIQTLLKFLNKKTDTY